MIISPPRWWQRLFAPPCEFPISYQRQVFRCVAERGHPLPHRSVKTDWGYSKDWLEHDGDKIVSRCIQYKNGQVTKLEYHDYTVGSFAENIVKDLLIQATELQKRLDAGNEIGDLLSKAVKKKRRTK